MQITLTSNVGRVVALRSIVAGSAVTVRATSKDEYVLGWRVATNQGEGTYGLVDSKGWPIVVGDRGRKGTTKLKLVG